MPVVSLPFAQSGQRLKAWWVAGNTIDLFSNFHDRELGVDCEFAPRLADTRQACFPRTRVEVVYADSACTEPLAFVETLGEPELSEWVSALGTEPNEFCPGLRTPLAGYHVGELYFAGGDVAVGTDLPTAFAKVGSSCEATSIQRGLLPASLFRIALADDDRFVSGPVVTLPATGGFGVRRVVADDGAELTVGIFDDTLTPCAVQRDGLCVPLPFASGSLAGPTSVFADAGCSAAAFAQSPDPACGQPRLGLETVNDGQSRVFELEEVRPAYFHHENIGPDGQSMPTCDLEGSLGGLMARAEVTERLHRAGIGDSDEGSMHLLQHWSPWSGDAPIIPFEAGGAFVDAEGGSCRITEPVQLYTDDGVPLCYPDGPEVADLGATFRDPACREQLFHVYDGGGDSPDYPHVAALREVRWSDATLLSFEGYTGPTYSTLGGNGCEPAGETPFALAVSRAVPLPRMSLVER